MKRKIEEANLVVLAEDYFNNIFSEVAGMKALLLDDDTSGIISVIYTQSKLYKNDIYLIQKLSQKSEKLSHLKAIFLVRPTQENIQYIKNQLKQPRYYEYHIFFTNQISQRKLQELASCDNSDKVKTFQQVYIDYYALSKNLCSLNIPSVIGLNQKLQHWKQSDKKVLNRISDGLISLVMSMRLMPQIRFLNSSDACGNIAEKLANKMQTEKREKPSDYYLDQRAIVLITQRKQDVITPMLTPWTYQAMLHEYIGMYNNKVDIVNRQKAFLLKDPNAYLSLKQKEQRQFVLSQLTDQFYRNNINSSFGELANNIKSFISQVSLKRNKNMKLDSLQDMQGALDKMPELNQQSATLQKHLTLTYQIKQTIEKSLLFEVSKIQQDLVCQDARSNSIEGIWKIMKNQAVHYYLKLKLIVMYSVKYPNDKQIKNFLAYLSENGDDKSMLCLANLINKYQQNRKSDLFKDSNIKKKAKCFFDRMMKDVPNVYTQHKPYIFEEIIPDLLAEKLKESDYPTIFQGSKVNQGMYSTRTRPIIIVFFIGGATYIEAKQADSYEPAKVIIGGNFVHNSKTFLSEVIQLGSMPLQQQY